MNKQTKPATAAAVESKRQQKAPAPVMASAFVLVDDQGRTRAHLRMEDGEPALDLYDAEGVSRLRVALEHLEEAQEYDVDPRIEFANADNNSQMAISAGGPNGNPGIWASNCNNLKGSALEIVANGPLALVGTDGIRTGKGLNEVRS